MSQRSHDLLHAKTGVLLPAAARAAVAMYRPVLRRLRLTHPQYLVLLTLDDGQTHSFGEISDRLALTGGTMTPMLKRLTILGYIIRTRAREDERRVMVTLTDTGRELIPELRDIRDQVNRDIGLTHAERERLQLFIESLRSATTPTGQEKPAS